MSRYFTSDLHLGSSNINKYANRPFYSAEDAVKKLVANINDSISFGGCLIHAGDFMLNGADRHDNIEDRGLSYSLSQYLNMMPERRIVLLSGNHDDGHNCEADCKSMFLDLNQNWRNVYVNHFPSNHKYYHGPKSNSSHKLHINICGHVHDKWLLMFDFSKHVLNVNVGVDVWNYKPVRDAEITEMLEFILNAHDMNYDWYMTRTDYNKYQKEFRRYLDQSRKRRKLEKHAKKGLTPEECERRKQIGIKISKAKKLSIKTSYNIDVCMNALETCNFDMAKAQDFLMKKLEKHV